MGNQEIDENAARMQRAVAAGQPLHLGVTLSYVGNGSDKYWTAVLMDDVIVVQFGPHMTEGQFKTHDDLGTREKAAAKFWTLLREKVAKGYAVVDGACMIVPDPADPHRYSRQRAICRSWDQLRQARRLNPKRLHCVEDLPGRSPRTGKQGGKVILALTDPHPDAETLVGAAVAGASEKFLPPMVISHPACPQEARFMAALAGTTDATR